MKEHLYQIEQNHHLTKNEALYYDYDFVGVIKSLGKRKPLDINPKE